MPEPDPRVLVAGEALIDIVHSSQGVVSEHVGGSPANVAVGLARLGHSTTLATHLGPDEHGARVAAYLQERDVRLSPGSNSAVRTSTATARVDAEGVARYDFDLTWEVPEVALAGVSHVHTGSIAATLEPGGSGVLELLRRAREVATTSYDPNLRPTVMGEPHQVRSRIEECVGLADVVKASAEDLAWLYAGAPVAEVAHLWGLLGPALVVVTNGEAGVLVLLPARESHVVTPTLPTPVVDTVGAGDSFMSGLLSGLLDAGLLGGFRGRERIRSSDPGEVGPAVRRALACAAYTVERSGAAAPTRAEISG